MPIRCVQRALAQSSRRGSPSRLALRSLRYIPSTLAYNLPEILLHPPERIKSAQGVEIGLYLSDAMYCVVDLHFTAPSARQTARIPQEFV
jgi:hypothetical protein